MLQPPRRWRAAAAVLVLTAASGACDTPSDGGLEPELAVTGWERTAFEVYSQNLYLGGNTGPLFDPEVVANLPLLVEEVGNFWADVQASDVAARMDEIAEEIALRNPEVVGLQEVLRFFTADGTFRPDGEGFIDFLGALEAAIAARGLPYERAVLQETTSSALPLAIDLAAGAVSQYLVFTDRIVILKRTDVVVSDSDSGTYFAAIPIMPGVDIRRGWARVTVNHEGTTHHFVNTHLETQRVREVHDPQAAELMGILGALDGVTILAGDLNSDAAAAEGDSSWTPTYGMLIDAGFADLWEIAPHARTDEGFTCCQADDLRNEVSELDERIDFVLVRSTEGPIPGDDARRGHFRADVVGDQAGDRTDGGLWPSDHAGLVAGIRDADAVADD